MMVQSAAPSARRLRAPTRKRATSSIGLLRGRQADARQLAAGERLEPLERQRQVHAALAAGHRVDLIDDHACACSRASRARTREPEEDVERLGRRDDDVRRAPAHGACARAAACRRCARRCGSRSAGKPSARQLGADAGERRLEVALDVVGERLERRDVDDVRLIRQAAAPRSPRAPARRSPRGTRRASCRSRWARRSGRAGCAAIAGQAARCAVGRRRERAPEPALTAG